MAKHSRAEERPQMFPNKPKSRFPKHEKGGKPDFRGPSRRTVNLIPRPETEQGCHAHKYGEHNRPEQLLLSVEATQATCCIHLSSPYYKSRSAALIFRGRILGCVYGNKHLPYQLFGKTAYDYMHRELSHRESELQSYPLDEELVLAAAAMFNGEIIDPLTQSTPEEAFRFAHEALIHCNRPGTIVILDENASAIYSAFYFRGKTVGAYSHEDGWLKPQYESAEHYLRNSQGASVFGATLTARGIEDVWNQTFSLSGLGDRHVEDWHNQQSQDLKNVMLIGFANRKDKRPNKSVEMNRFIPKYRQSPHPTNRNVQVDNPFKINTLLGG
jgi:hypothetical protein